MNVEVRRLVKDAIRRKLRIHYAGISRDGVSAVILRVHIGGTDYEALGTAKWQRPDEFSVRDGLSLAYRRALVELVDRVVEPNRRNLSVRYT